jgi:hypothetical protein
MEEAKNGRGISRRGFLKGLGGGAIGTAVIASGGLSHFVIDTDLDQRLLNAMLAGTGPPFIVTNCPF